MHKHNAFLIAAAVFFMMSPFALGAEDHNGLAKSENMRPAPPLSLEHLLQAPLNAHADLSDLKGKVVVVNFWATWCGPCKASRPLFNKLQEKFHDQPVIFLSITDEEQPIVTKYLQENPIRGWVGIDTDRSTFDAYGVRGIPRTALIDRAGNLVGWTTSDFLYNRPEILQKVIDGVQVTLSATAELEGRNLFADVNISDHVQQNESQVPLCMILIRPASGGDIPSGGTRRERRVNHVTLREIVTIFFPEQWGAIAFDFAPADDKYDILFRWPEGVIEHGEELLRDAIKTTFGITVQKEKRSTDVYVLRVTDGSETSWERSGASVQFDKKTGNTAPTQALLDRINAGESFFQTMGRMKTLANSLSYVLDRPVIDESAIDGYYSFYFPWSKETSSYSEVIQTVKDKYGIILTLTRREIPTLVVRKREE